MNNKILSNNNADKTVYLWDNVRVKKQLLYIFILLLSIITICFYMHGIVNAISKKDRDDFSTAEKCKKYHNVINSKVSSNAPYQITDGDISDEVKTCVKQGMCAWAKADCNKEVCPPAKKAWNNMTTKEQYDDDAGKDKGHPTLLHDTKVPKFVCKKAVDTYSRLKPIIDNNKKDQAKICVKWDGQTYVESVMRKCNDPDFCTVKKDHHLDCSKAKALLNNGGGSGGSSSGGGASGGSGSGGGASSGGSGGSSSGGSGGSGSGGGSGGLSGSAGNCGGGDFLGFPSWSRGLTCKGDTPFLEPGKELGMYITIILLNIVDILLRLASIVAFIVILYGGIRYVVDAHAGKSLAESGAKMILVNGVIGLIVAISAAAIVTFVVGSLSGGH